MVGKDRRAHQRFPAWIPVDVRIDAGGAWLPAMLCDVSTGGALVWGSWEELSGETAVLRIVAGPETFFIPAKIVSVEHQWDTAVLHLQFAEGLLEESPRLAGLIGDLRGHFVEYQVYLARRGEANPALARPPRHQPDERASA